MITDLISYKESHIRKIQEYSKENNFKNKIIVDFVQWIENGGDPRNDDRFLVFCDFLFNDVNFSVQEEEISLLSLSMTYITGEIDILYGYYSLKLILRVISGQKSGKILFIQLDPINHLFDLVKSSKVSFYRRSCSIFMHLLSEEYSRMYLMHQGFQNSLFEYINELFSSLQPRIGLEMDHFLYVLCILISIPQYFKKDELENIESYLGFLLELIRFASTVNCISNMNTQISLLFIYIIPHINGDEPILLHIINCFRNMMDNCVEEQTSSIIPIIDSMRIFINTFKTRLIIDILDALPLITISKLLDNPTNTTKDYVCLIRFLSSYSFISEDRSNSFIQEEVFETISEIYQKCSYKVRREIINFYWCLATNCSTDLIINIVDQQRFSIMLSFLEFEDDFFDDFLKKPFWDVMNRIIIQPFFRNGYIYEYQEAMDTYSSIHTNDFSEYWKHCKELNV